MPVERCGLEYCYNKIELFIIIVHMLFPRRHLDLKLYFLMDNPQRTIQRQRIFGRTYVFLVVFTNSPRSIANILLVYSFRKLFLY